MNRHTFLHGALVLMIAGLVTRVMGFIYRIFLTRIIGAEGMGLFQIVFPILGLVLTFVTMGFPLAISKLVAEAVAQRDRARIHRIMRISGISVACLAALFTLLMYLLRHVIETHWLTDPRAYPTYLAMIPVVGIIAVSSLYRGYFQGLQDMAPTAWASILEQTVRILSIWILAAYFVRYSLSYAAAAAMMGMVLGELSGLLFMVFQQRRRARLVDVVPEPAYTRAAESMRSTVHAIGQISLPVTLSKLIWSLLFAAEPVLVMRALQAAGFVTSQATSMYGEYSGMAIPLLVFPTVITSSLATNLVPAVSEAAAAGEMFRIRKRLSQSFTATALISFPASVIFTLFAGPLTSAIYKQPNIGPILAIMAPFEFLLCLQAPLTGILQGLNRAGVAMVNSIVGGVAKLLLVVVLARRPELGILGVSMATAFSFTLSTLLNLWFVVRMIGFHIRLQSLLRVGIAALCMFVYMQVITYHRPVPGTTLLLAIGGGLLLYLALLCTLRVLTSRAVSRIPKIGPALSRIVRWMPFAV
ncbi:stage V sporulation protein B [Alicyclobacillus sacchari]|uniref:Stage V sporulation protein B n=1 Tax=Alicyclobacillus sacchari TaxID=392010 RepID=A0A4R8LTL4_9BACL|nr:stage V sporulation protein B [Alicyclobacillus sacchari]TDY51053.1 stage V sporulation protein B [Alicyclobacillus sacchari]GMA56276.1 stage V sporulation protein B [Alicyclobacillus sacchari]